MLQFIREKTSGLIALTIVTLLIITFAFWGVSFYFDQSGEVVAITVNDAEIDLREYQRIYQGVRRQWQEALGDDGGTLDDELVKKQTIDSLIERELVAQVNDSLNLRVSAAQVRSVINELPAFQGERGFDNFLYERAVSQVGLTPVAFENELQEDMKAEQLQASLAESIIVTDEEVQLIVAMRNQSRDFSYTIISSNELKEEIEVSEEEISDFYQRNIQDYMDPEKVKIAYIDLALQKIATGLELDEEALQAYYEDNRADYDVEDQRQVRHITIALPEEQSPGDIEEASARAQELIDLLKGGMSFDELSENHSDDPKFSIEMSELGFLTRGIMPAEVDEVMFSLDEGEISAPIATSKSVDVIRVDKIKGGVKNTLDNVREAVEEAWRLSAAENEYFELNDQLANLAYEHPDSLDVPAEELGLVVQESDFISRESTDDPLLSHNRIKSAAFSDEVLNGNNSELLEVGDNRVVVLRVLEHVSAKPLPLDQVSERIVTRIKYEQASQQVSEKGEAILEKLKAGSDAEALAEEYNVVWTPSTAIKRDNTGINRAVVRTAFRLGRPADGESIFGGSSLGSGDYALVILTGVNDPDPATFNDADVANVRNQLLRLKAGTTWQQLVKDIRKTADVNVFEDRL